MIDHSKDTPERQAFRLATMARGRALTKYEDGWRFFTKEIQNALILSEVALIIADQNGEDYESAALVVETSIEQMGF
jgi:hypothetical protein